MEKIPTPGNSEGKKESKTFLYHMVPADMQGTVLHPLNSLKDSHPELYISKASKYEDRKHIMDQFLPTLEAAWNDVIHFTAINPTELKQALIEAGMEPREMSFYQIDPELLNPEQTTIYLYQDRTSDEKMSPKNFSEYDPENLGQHAVISEETKEYYKKMFTAGDKPLLFVGVPHILHKGSLDVSDLPVITV